MINPLNIDFLGFHCENPFLLSSSCVGANYDMVAKSFDMGWGGVVFKSISYGEFDEVSPRFAVIKRTPNSIIGLKNLENRAENHSAEWNFDCLAKIKKAFPEKLVVASICGRNEEEWTQLSKSSEQAGVDMIEANFGCPHTYEHDLIGAAVGEDPELVKAYCGAVRKGTKLPILAKMTVNATHMEIPAKAALEGGANGVSAINTINCITGVDLDSIVGAPNIQGKSAPGGYSGNAVKPIALRFIRELAMHRDLNGMAISGMGGIENWRDALEFMLLGAGTVQVTTAIMQYGYRVIENLIEGTSHYLEEKGIEHIGQIVGKGLANMVEPNQLVRGVNMYPIHKEDECVGCGRCYISCYDGGHQAIEWDYKNRRPITDYDKCVACNLCTDICPVEAIRLENGEKK